MNIITEQRISVATLKQKMQDHDKKIICRNKALNEILSEWDIRTLVDKNTSDIGMAIIRLL